MQDSPNFYSPKVSGGKFAKVFLRQTFALYGITLLKPKPTIDYISLYIIMAMLLTLFNCIAGNF